MFDTMQSNRKQIIRYNLYFIKKRFLRFLLWYCNYRKNKNVLCQFILFFSKASMKNVVVLYTVIICRIAQVVNGGVNLILHI